MSGIEKPIEPGRLFSGFSPAITGEASVMPYPCTTLIPMSSNPFVTSGSRAEAPLTMYLSLPPSSSRMSLNSFLLISMWNFSRNLLILSPRSKVFLFPCLSIASWILLYIASIRSGTHTKTVTLYSLIFFCMYLRPSQKTVVVP